MRSITTTTALCALTFGAPPGFAASVTLDSIAVQWQNPTFQAGDAQSSIEGNAISWGRSLNGGPVSSYVFSPREELGVIAENPFALGQFTHNNFVVGLPAIESVDLELSVRGSIDGVAFEIDPVFGFDHLETPNDAFPCAAGGFNPCADLVTLENGSDLSELVTVDGQDFTVVVEGFLDAESGEARSNFLTTERQANSALLQARIDEVGAAAGGDEPPADPAPDPGGDEPAEEPTPVAAPPEPAPEPEDPAPDAPPFEPPAEPAEEAPTPVAAPAGPDPTPVDPAPVPPTPVDVPSPMDPAPTTPVVAPTPIEPAPAPVPLPAAGFALLAGLGGLGALRLRRRR